jgi:hypothetical protein
MKDSRDAKAATRPLPYEPPRVRKVKLVPDELAVSGCKSTMITTELCRRGPGQVVSRFRGS